MAWRRGAVRLRTSLRQADIRLYLLGAVLGVAVAYAVVGFRLVIDLIGIFTFGVQLETAASGTSALPWWHVALVPALGGLVVGVMVHLLMPDRRPQAVAQVIEATASADRPLGARAGLGAALVSATSLGVGASTGREGPAVHLGATVASLIGRWLALGRGAERTLLACGAAAAVAASFNAPIAGVFFAAEVVMGPTALVAVGPIVVASVAATVVSRHAFGNIAAFELPADYAIVSNWEFGAFFILGIVSALVAIILMRSIFFAAAVAEKYGPRPVFRPLLAGAAVGVMAIWLPEVLGVGYEATNEAVLEQLSLTMMITLIVAKTAATAICAGGGFGGGVFSPALFLGAMTGGAFGIVATSVFPEVSGTYGSYTLVGMGAVAGAVIGSPMSAIMIIFEMTADFTLTVGVMLAVVTAFAIVRHVEGGGFFAQQLARAPRREGEGSVQSWHGVPIDGTITRAHVTIAEDTPLADIVEILDRRPDGQVIVVNGAAELVGLLSWRELGHEGSIGGEHGARPDLTAGDLADRDVPVLFRGESLAEAGRILEGSWRPWLPVVDSTAERHIVGIMRQSDLSRAYRRTIGAIEAPVMARGRPR